MLTFKWLTVVTIRARYLNAWNLEVVVSRVIVIYLNTVHG